MSDSAAKQNVLRDFVGREVLYCVSYLVDELARGKHMDELMEVCIQDDWQSPAEEEGFAVAPVMCDRGNNWVPAGSEDEVFSWLYYKREEGLDAALQAEDVDSRINQYSEAVAWRAACEDNDIDPRTNEAYEHWLVTGWFAERLKEKGEMVIDDFLGLTIWGRGCTGQAIYLDYVVEQIYDEMMEKKAVRVAGLQLTPKDFGIPQLETVINRAEDDTNE